MREEIKLEPCPFCGSDDVVFGAGLEDEYYVECWDCSAKVESCNGLEDAIAGWNARAIDRDELLRIAEELEGAEKWCDKDGVYGTGIVSISEPKLREWSDRIRKLAKKECQRWHTAIMGRSCTSMASAGRTRRT